MRASDIFDSHRPLYSQHRRMGLLSQRHAIVGPRSLAQGLVALIRSRGAHVFAKTGAVQVAQHCDIATELLFGSMAKIFGGAQKLLGLAGKSLRYAGPYGFFQVPWQSLAYRRNCFRY